jgi:hypothetical protein
MEISRMFRWIVLVLSFQVIAPIAHSQLIEVDGGIGYSAVNITSWSSVEPNDWNNLSGFATAQGFYRINKTISVGISAGFHHLFWYEYKDYYDYWYSKEVNAARITALTRFHFGRNFVDVGAGPFIFNDFVDFAVVASYGYAFKLTDKLSLPIKVNCSVIFDSDASVVPFTISTGLSYRIK